MDGEYVSLILWPSESYRHTVPLNDPHFGATEPRKLTIVDANYLAPRLGPGEVSSAHCTIGYVQVASCIRILFHVRSLAEKDGQKRGFQIQHIVPLLILHLFQLLSPSSIANQDFVTWFF